MLRDGKPVLVIGTPGGSRIITVVLQVILNTVDYGMDLQEAIDAPRIHQQWLPESTFVEGIEPRHAQSYSARWVTRASKARRGAMRRASSSARRGSAAHHATEISITARWIRAVIPGWRRAIELRTAHRPFVAQRPSSHRSSCYFTNLKLAR